MAHVALPSLSLRPCRFLVSGFAACLALVVVEVVLRARSPVAERYEVWWPHLHQVFYPSPEILPGIAGEKHFIVNSLGLRGDEPPQGTRFRFLTVGGSATECLYLDQDESWPEAAARNLAAALPEGGVWVGNAGKSGLNTRDHVVQMRRLAPQLAELDLDAILYLVGVNDLCVRLAEDGSYDPLALERPAVEEAIVRRVFQRVPRSEEHRLPFWKQSAVYATAARLNDRWFGTQAIQDDVGAAVQEWRDHRANASAFKDKLPDLASALAEFQRNLYELALLSERIGARAVFITQPAIWRADLSPDEEAHLWFGGVGPFMAEDGCPYYTPRALAEGLELFNRATVEAAGISASEVVDLAGRIPKGLEHFYDDVHFNERGSAAVADAVAEYLALRPPFSESSDGAAALR